MSRQEDFIEAGIQYRFKHGTPMAIGGGHFAEMTREVNRNRVYEDGAEYGYQYGKEEMAKKMCNIIRGKLMQFTNEENERILPPIPLILFVDEIYKEAMED